MKKALGIVLITLTGVAFASCPSYAPYGCTQGANGKMICGCGR